MGNCHSVATTIHMHQPSNKGGVVEVYSEGKSKYHPIDEADMPYSILCLNNTDENYYFAVYQDFPMSPGLKSLAWQVRRLPKKGSGPSHNLISWPRGYLIESHRRLLLAVRKPSKK